MSQSGYLQPKCWCGEGQSAVFSPHYRQCAKCKTLFLATPLPKEHFEVRDDESGFYGEKYWTQHVVEDYGLPHIQSRTRTDLPERNLHWLRALLSYALPEKKVLEIACAHGSFVALLRRAGFDATGLDVSPAILEYARKIFGIPTIRGPVEDAGLPTGKLDVIAAMDVLEHFTDPLDSMRRLGELLNDDGLMLIQTPCLHEPDVTFEQLQASNDRFLAHLKEDEHIYLLNKNAMREFLSRLGFYHVEFLEPAFDYDMFFAASRRPLVEIPREDVNRALMADADRRMVLALIDLDDRRREVYESWQEAERDRVARLRVIERQGEKAQELAASLDQAEAAIQSLTERVAAHEEALGGLRAQLEHAEADRAARLRVIEEQGERVGALESALNGAEQRLASVSTSLESAEADRAARLEVIEKQGAYIGDLAGQRDWLQRRTAELQATLEAAEDELEALRQRFTGTLVGKTLTASGWIRLPPARQPEKN